MQCNSYPNTAIYIYLERERDLFVCVYTNAFMFVRDDVDAEFWKGLFIFSGKKKSSANGEGQQPLKKFRLTVASFVSSELNG